MKNLLAGLFIISGILATNAQVELLPIPTPEAHRATAVYTPNAVPSQSRKAPRGAAPASLVGKKYVSFYGSFTNYGQRCGGVIIQQSGTDSLLLKGFAMGYDVKAKYDAATGKITVPTNVVIGKNNAGTDITLYRLIAANNYTRYDDKPVVGTFDGIAEPNPTEITIPEGVTDLRYAFYYYIPLKKVTFASTVTDAYYALAYCSRLTDVKLNEGIKNIGSVLYGCSSLKSVDVPHSVETLGARAFFNLTVQV